MKSWFLVDLMVLKDAATKTFLVLVTLAVIYIVVQGVIQLLDHSGYGKEKGPK